MDRALADPALRDRVFAEHQGALDAGVNGIPALVVPGYAPVTGAIPLDVLRRASPKWSTPARRVPSFSR